MSTAYLRSRRRVHRLPRWRIVRYADDFVVLVHGDRSHVEALREDVATVLRRVRRAAWGNGPGAIPAPRPRPTQPERAAVFSFDEKTQCQALDRTQPSLPMKRGRGATMTHDYKRHGTIDLFAAMNVATGQVHTHLRKGHTGADVLAFFKQIDKTVPKDLAVQ